MMELIHKYMTANTCFYKIHVINLCTRLQECDNMLDMIE